MTYQLRHNGLLHFEMPSTVAENIMNRTKGFFRTATLLGKNVTVYEVTEDMIMTVANVRISIWCGSLLIPK